MRKVVLDNKMKMIVAKQSWQQMKQGLTKQAQEFVLDKVMNKRAKCRVVVWGVLGRLA